jgi:hypothetical protein
MSVTDLDASFEKALAAIRVKEHSEKEEVAALIAILQDSAYSRARGETEAIDLGTIKTLTRLNIARIKDLWQSHRAQIKTAIPGIGYDEDTVGGKYQRVVVRYFTVPGMGTTTRTSKAAASAESAHEKKVSTQREKLDEITSFVEAHAKELRLHPHPFEFRAAKGDSLHDYARYVLGQGTSVTQKKRDLMKLLRTKLEEPPPESFAALARTMAEAPRVIPGHVYHSRGPCKVVGYEDRRIALFGPFNHKVVDASYKLKGSWNGSAWIFGSHVLEEVKKLCDLYGP